MPCNPAESSHDFVQRAQKKISRGLYDWPPDLDHALEQYLHRLLSDLDAVPYGNGPRYQDAVQRVLSGTLDSVFDGPNSDIEVANRGARIDIEFPLRLEVLSKFPLFKQWTEWYEIRSILVEVKNERKRAGVGHAKQIVGDLAVAQRGGLAFLIARSGFTRPAMRYLGELAQQRNFMVLPLDHNDLRQVIENRASGYDATMTLLRVRQNELLRVA